MGKKDVGQRHMQNGSKLERGVLKEELAIEVKKLKDELLATFPAERGLVMFNIIQRGVDEEVIRELVKSGQFLLELEDAHKRVETLRARERLGYNKGKGKGS